MLNLFQNFKPCFVLCFLIKLYVAEYPNDNFTILENSSPIYEQTEVNNQTEYHVKEDSDNEDYNNYSLLIDINEFDFDEIFSEQNITDLIKFLRENWNSMIYAVHNKTVRVDCENVFFTNSRLEYLGRNRIKLECVKEFRPNAINVCIKQKASMGLARSYESIIPGSFVRMNIFPHMVAIGYPESESHPTKDSIYLFGCGGTLISDKYVLTAAHCFKGNQPTVLRLGVNDLLAPSRDFDFEQLIDVNISKILIHPLYKRKRKYHDIALIELEHPVELSLAIYPACLDTTIDIMDGTELIVSGWGLNEERKQLYNLQYGKMTTVSRSECTEKYGRFGLKNSGIPNGILESQVCTGNFTSKIVDTCTGDSGGPLLSKPGYGFVSTIHGITSFGFRCGTDPPSVFTKVSYYRDWIESVVWPQINDKIPI